MSENKSFNYTYSSSQQSEIDEIRRKYLPKEPKEEDKLEKLRRLDKSAEQKGTIASMIIGIVFTLIFGLGICCVLEWGCSQSVLYWALSEWRELLRHIPFTRKSPRYRERRLPPRF